MENANVSQSAPTSTVDPVEGGKELKDRLLNVLKLSARMSTPNAFLRLTALFWILASILVCLPNAYDPVTYPINVGFIFSIIIYAAYHGIIGGVQKKSAAYVKRLVADYQYDLSQTSIKKLQAELEGEEIILDRDDPVAVRWISKIINFFCRSRRGSAQTGVVLAQIIILGCYVYNYVHFFGEQTVANFPDMLWQVHGAVTLIGVISIIKNASFLITNRFLFTLASLAFFRHRVRPERD